MREAEEKAKKLCYCQSKQIPLKDNVKGIDPSD